MFGSTEFLWNGYCSFQGLIVAFDKSEPKIAKLKLNCDRLGVQCVKTFVFDGVKALDPDKRRNTDNSTGMYSINFY